MSLALGLAVILKDFVREIWGKKNQIAVKRKEKEQKLCSPERVRILAFIAMSAPAKEVFV